MTTDIQQLICNKEFDSISDHKNSTGFLPNYFKFNNIENYT